MRSEQDPGWVTDELYEGRGPRGRWWLKHVGNHQWDLDVEHFGCAARFGSTDKRWLVAQSSSIVDQISSSKEAFKMISIGSVVTAAVTYVLWIVARWITKYIT